MPELTTADGERLVTVHMEGPDPERSLAVVVGHGMAQSISRPGTRAVIMALARHAGVVAIDFRGHGGSTGISTCGRDEVLDLDAAVGYARELGYADIVTCGWSMGGSIVLRHAALHGGIDAVVSVSAVSRWFVRDTWTARTGYWGIETRLGRLVVRHALKTRIFAEGWDPDALPEAPVEVIGRISPIPVLIVHGDRDRMFPLAHAEALFTAANEPKEFWVEHGFGHAENSASPDLVERIGRHLPVLVSRGAGRSS